MSAVPKLFVLYRSLDYEYIYQRDRWIKEHPNATPREYEIFIQQLCKRLGL